MRYPGFFFCLSFFLSTQAHAGFYRCTGDHGEPSYSQQPCGSSGIRVLQGSGATGRTQGLRASERAWLEQRRRKAGKAGKSASQRAAGTSVKEGSDRRQAYRCRVKRRALDKVRAQLRRGYKPASGEKLRRRRSAYEDYLATFCS